jgi:hypothetical protein
VAERFESWPAPQGPPPPAHPGQPHPGQFAPGGPPPGHFRPVPPPAFRPPSGLFPGLPPRPVYREPHPVRAAALMAGLGSGLLWLALFGSLAKDLASYAWWTLIAAATAWVVALVLSVLGDRGAAVGLALASGFGLSIAVVFVTGRWITTYDWPLW